MQDPQSHFRAIDAVALHNYPRPQLVRRDWTCLDGSWEFEYDDQGLGLREHWERPREFAQEIQVPFPPESSASGIGDPDNHSTMWYRRTIDASEVTNSGDERVLLHFGAVDYEATVWVDGHRVGDHRGGNTPFTLDITDSLESDRDQHTLIVRCHDDALDVEAARGKQDWRPEPHVVWYARTSGIWQTVWLEIVPQTHIESIAWTSNLVHSTVTASIRFNARPKSPVSLRILLTHDGETLAVGEFGSDSDLAEVTLHVPRQRNGQAAEELWWSPENPVLIDAQLTLKSGGQEPDEVASYLGLVDASVSDGAFLLNERPYHLRSVLSQGYWPNSHLAAPSPAALREEVELIKSLGFNSVRIHQKLEDPRFLFWCDRLGLSVWSEFASSYAFTSRAVTRFAVEWAAAVERDKSHPSIITWVPMNESWGIQYVAHDPAQQAFCRAMTELTRSLDPTRPVISNDGWEHVSSDIATIHDYTDSPEEITALYGGSPSNLLSGIGPAGRRMRIGGEGWREDAPVMLTEFGGIAFTATPEGETWGYSRAEDAGKYEAQLSALVGAVRRTPLAGFCYTQLTDTLQEANGLCTADRQPKLPLETLRRIIAG